MSEELRTLDETIALARLEPSIKEVYVEGEFDKRLIRWINNKYNIKSCVVKCIKCINITNDEVKEFGFINAKNNKAKIVTLAKKVEEHIPNCKCILCLADKDLDEFCERLIESPLLLYYDWTSIEMAFFNELYLNKLLLLAYPKVKMCGRQIIEAFTPILKSLFAARVVLDVKCVQSRLIWRRLLRYSDNDLTFDLKESLVRTLNTAGRIEEKDVIVQHSVALLENLDCDYRKCIRGHDFTDLFAWFVAKKSKDTKLNNTSDIERVLLAAVEEELLLLGCPVFVGNYQKWLCN